MLIRYLRLAFFTFMVFLLVFYSIQHDITREHFKFPQGYGWLPSWPSYDLKASNGSLHSSMHHATDTSIFTVYPTVSVSHNGSEDVSVTRIASVKPEPTPTPKPPSPYAFVFYATEDNYACSVIVNIARLVKYFNTRHRIFVLASPDVSEQYLEPMREMNATVSIQPPPPAHKNGNPYYKNCLLKLLAFKMHQIEPTLKRVLVLDGDQLILRNLDHIFELPPVDIAAPRAYWIEKDAISSTFMLINLSDRLWGLINERMKTIQENTFDMDIVNEALGKTALVLPGSYVTLNSHWETWSIPDWFRPEEITAMNEAGKTTAASIAVQREKSGTLPALAWAIDRWKDDIDNFVFEDATMEAEGEEGLWKMRKVKKDVMPEKKQMAKRDMAPQAPTETTGDSSQAAAGGETAKAPDGEKDHSSDPKPPDGGATESKQDTKEPDKVPDTPSSDNQPSKDGSNAPDTAEKSQSGEHQSPSELQKDSSDKSAEGQAPSESDKTGSQREDSPQSEGPQSASEPKKEGENQSNEAPQPATGPETGEKPQSENSQSPSEPGKEEKPQTDDSKQSNDAEKADKSQSEDSKQLGEGKKDGNGDSKPASDEKKDDKPQSDDSKQPSEGNKEDKPQSDDSKQTNEDKKEGDKPQSDASSQPSEENKDKPQSDDSNKSDESKNDDKSQSEDAKPASEPKKNDEPHSEAPQPTSGPENAQKPWENGQLPGPEPGKQEISRPDDPKPPSENGQPSPSEPYKAATSGSSESEKVVVNKDEVNPVLNDLFRVAYVLHFTAGGKPWSLKLEDLKSKAPDAHVLFSEQWKMWRQIAQLTCPGFNLTQPTGTGEFDIVHEPYIKDI